MGNGPGGLNPLKAFEIMAPQVQQYSIPPG
jgi:hypothetical protein